MKRITFTIGQGETWNGKPIWKDGLATRRKVAYQYVAKIFGGFTAREGFGGWFDAERNEVVYEPSLTIIVLAESSKLVEVNPTAARLRDHFSQSCVAVTVETLDSLEFI